MKKESLVRTYENEVERLKDVVTKYKATIEDQVNSNLDKAHENNSLRAEVKELRELVRDFYDLKYGKWSRSTDELAEVCLTLEDKAKKLLGDVK